MKVSVGKFLWFQRRVLGLYLCVMGFITVLLYVEPTMSIHYTNLIYIYIVTSFFLTVYLTVEFLYLKRRFLRMEAHWHEGVLIQEGLGEPKTYEQYLYRQLFQTVNEAHQQKMYDIVQEKKEMMAFMTSWFHDIKTPIAVGKLVIERASKTEELQSLYEELDRIDSFVEQALYFVRTDTFNKDYFILQTALDKVVRAVVKRHAKGFIQKKIKLDFQVESIEILTDKKWLDYVLAQIISNSLKYTEEGGEIIVQSEEDSKEARLIISDSGIGISRSDVPRIFEKGFTGENGRIYGKSTGMGLYLAKKLVNKLGHELSITSEKDQYTTVTVHFPKGQDYYSVF